MWECDRCNICDMADLNLRDVDPELVKELKQAAIAAGWTLKELCIHRLKGVTYGEIRKKHYQQPPTEKPSPKIEREERAREIEPVPQVEAESGAGCPRHGKSQGFAKAGGWWCMGCTKIY
jgi:hypothetical protein